MRSHETPFDGPWFRRGLWTALFLVASLPLIATLVLAVVVDGDEVAAWLGPKLSGALNRGVTVGEAGVALLPRPGIRLSDVRVGGAEGSDVPSVITVRDAHLDVAFLPLFVGRVHADRVRLSGLDVHLTITEDGASNFGDLVPESSVVDVSREGPVQFGVEEVEVDDASVTWFDGPRDRSFALMAGSGSVAIDIDADGRWIASVEGSADSLHVRLPAVTEEIVRTDAPSVTLSIGGDRSLDWVEIEEGTLTQWEEPIQVSGRVDGISDADPRLNLLFVNEALDLGRFIQLVPPATRMRTVPALEGTMDMRLSLRGSLRGDQGPALTGSLRLSKAGLRLGGDPLMTDLNGRIGIRSGVVALDSIVGTFAEGPFLFSGELDRTNGTLAATLVASPDLEAFEQLGLTPFGSTLAGEADLVLEVAGPVDAVDSMSLNGSFRASGVQVEHDGIGVPLYGPSVEIELVESELRWTDLNFLVGSDPLTSSGRLDRVVTVIVRGGTVPLLEASFVGDRLDLGALLPPEEPRPDVSYARIAFAHLGGREIDGRAPSELVELAGFERPETLPVHGSIDLEVDRLDYGIHELGDVSARIVLSDSVLVVDDATFEAWEGDVRAAMRMGVGDRVDEPFTLDLRMENVDAPLMLSAMTPVGEAVTGRLALEMALEGSVDRTSMPVPETLTGTGTVAIAAGRVTGTGINLALADFLAEERWRSIPFDAWSTDLEIREGMFDISVSRLEGARASATLSGAVGMGGAVDLAMALSIPPGQLEAVSLRRTGVAQTVLDQLRSSESSLDLGIRISGTLQGPTLEPDALAATERVSEAVR